VYRSGTLLYRPTGLLHAERFGPSGAACALIDPDATWIEAREYVIRADRPCSLAAIEAARLGTTLWRELKCPDAFTAIVCEAAVWESLVLIGRAMEKAPPRPSDVSIAMEFLRAHSGRPFRLADAAQAAGVHCSTLARHFRLALGCSVGAYVRRLRVERAAQLLEHDAMPLEELALECGFASQAHLTTLFRRAMGTTPAVYRRQRRA
jgi:AraC family transcriptional regulator